MSIRATPGASRRKNLSRMTADFEIKAKDEGARTFEGALATSHLDLGDGRYRDIVHPRGFVRWIDHFHAAKAPYVPLLDSHRYDSILNVFGKLLEAEEVLTGEILRYDLKDGGVLEVAEMYLNTKWEVIPGADGERVLDRLTPGAVRKMSMGYEPLLKDFVELAAGPARNLREVRVDEGSLVVFGMNPEAETDPATVKALFDALRDGTLTEEDEQEIRQLPDDVKARFRALLEAAPPAPDDEPPADTQKNGPAPTDALTEDEARRLALRLRLVKLRSPARRTDPASHALSL